MKPELIKCLTKGLGGLEKVKARFNYNYRGYSFVVLKTPVIRRLLAGACPKHLVEGLTMWDVIEYARGLGLVVFAFGSDGSNSSWVLAVDPADGGHRQFLRDWCRSYRFIFDLPRLLPGLPEGVREVVKGTVRAVLEAVGGDVARLGLTVFLGGGEVAVALVNTKVRVAQTPCELLARLGGGRE